jgi:hypothetical protein
MLIPHSLQNRTALDIVLARLLFVSEAEDFDALDVSVPDTEPPVTNGPFTGLPIERIG